MRLDGCIVRTLQLRYNTKRERVRSFAGVELPKGLLHSLRGMVL